MKDFKNPHSGFFFPGQFLPISSQFLLIRIDCGGNRRSRIASLVVGLQPRGPFLRAERGPFSVSGHGIIKTRRIETAVRVFILRDFSK